MTLRNPVIDRTPSRPIPCVATQHEIDELRHAQRTRFRDKPWRQSLPRSIKRLLIMSRASAVVRASFVDACLRQEEARQLARRQKNLDR